MFRVKVRHWSMLFGNGSKAPVQPAEVLGSSLKRFAGDERGHVAMMFGLMAVTMFMFVGGAVDIGIWMQARRTTLEAIDSAALAGLRKYQETSNSTEAVAAAVANYKYNVSKRPAVLSDNISFVLKDNNTSMTATGNAVMQMSFLSLANVPSMNLVMGNGSEMAITKIGVGANTGTSLEISLMLDITGSMGESDGSGSTKLAAMKSAAQDMIDIVVWDDQGTYTSKVALVPFSEAVRLGATNTTLARGTVKTGTSTTPGSAKYTFMGTTFNIENNCVTERLGAEAYTDASPTSAPVGRMYKSSCTTSNQVVPLSNNKTSLKSAIGAYNASGNTAGHLGTAWAWYMLSPNFNTLWPSTAAARPYGDMLVLNKYGKPILKKIAVLMTDGDYNTEYCNGVVIQDKTTCTPNNGGSETQAPKLCTAMKAKGIEVYTIGFRVSAAAKTLLQNCATDINHYYDATDGNKLRQAFTDIAYKLVPPYIAH